MAGRKQSAQQANRGTTKKKAAVAESLDVEQRWRVPAERLRWRCTGNALRFETTDDVEPITGAIGQDRAMQALCFGLETVAPGQNVFVRGLSGTGRMTLVRRLLEEIRPACPMPQDRCYVHNFQDADRPKLITLPRRDGLKLRAGINALIEFIQSDFKQALSSDALKERQALLDKKTQKAIEAISKPFDEELRRAGMALVMIQAGKETLPAIVPIIEGEPVAFEDIEELVTSGKITREQVEQFKAASDKFVQKFDEIGSQIRAIQAEHRERLRKVVSTEAGVLLSRETASLRKQFRQHSRVLEFLEAIVNDILENRLKEIHEGDFDFVRLYEVNVLLSHEGDGCPIIVENFPTMLHLLGTIDRQIDPGEGTQADHRMIRAGSLLRADGGYLILEARDVLSEPGAWKVLIRTLRTGMLEIVPAEMNWPWVGPSLKPEPIELHVKVILLGDAELYYALDAYDPDFPNLFKVLADFDSVIPRNDESIYNYARVLARLAREEHLLPFDRTAVAALAEYGARIAARQDRLTTRFGRLADVAREASFVAGKGNAKRVAGHHVQLAVARSKKRADLPACRFREHIADGTIRIQTTGTAIGQINGLAVMSAGPLTYGFPARITATIGPGTAGAINIEREAQLSGSIHTKGFYILGGLLRFLLRPEHPLAFDASIAFEQSYGGIDGDSASGAEMCCLLSALTGASLRQDIAMTGAIDQVGHIQPVGAVTEKIEGFFDACNDVGPLTGRQGVVIPKANVRDLMLREDVLEACATGRFHVWAVETIYEALELLSGQPAGRRDDAAGGTYPHGTLLATAVKKARAYWEMAARQSGPVVAATRHPGTGDAEVQDETGGDEEDEG